MPSSKKAASSTQKSASQQRRENAAKDDAKVEARPIGEGKDPLAEGERLHNPTNTEAETHYTADRSELDDEEKASKIRGQNANERAEEHNTALTQGAPSHETPQHNEAQDEQNKVAEARQEEVVEENQVNDDDNAEEVELGDEESAADRQEAMDDAMAGGENPVANKKK